MDDDELASILNIPKQMLSGYRKSGMLPRKGSSIEVITLHLFNKNTLGTKKDQKLDQEIRRLRRINEKEAGTLVEKAKVETHIKAIYTNISSSIRTLSDQILNNIVAAPQHKETNKAIIETQCRRALSKIGEVNAEIKD